MADLVQDDDEQIQRSRGLGIIKAEIKSSALEAVGPAVEVAIESGSEVGVWREVNTGLLICEGLMMPGSGESGIRVLTMHRRR